MVTSNNMGLRIWNLVTDPYDHAQLADNFAKLDQHRHVFGEGVQIPTGGIEDGAITAEKLDASVLGGASPYFRAYISPVVSYASGATVVFDTETDPNGWYDNATGIFLPTMPGMYRVSWQIETSSLTAGKTLSSALAGPDIDGTSSSYISGFSSISRNSALLPFNGTTDSAHVVILHNLGSALGVLNTYSSHFEAERIGA